MTESSLSAEMEMSIKYTSSRKEVWEWYWYSWRKRLWIFHALFLVLFSFLFFTATNLRAQIYVLGKAIFVFGSFIAFPQIAFKPQERNITITTDNLYTKIGKREAHINWKQFGKVEDHGDFIILSRRNLNSFIIPNRAFSNIEEKDKFLAAVKQYVTKAKGFPNLISEAKDSFDL